MMPKHGVFTDKCENGVSSTNGRRCVANPQPFAGGNFVTYEMSSDDPQILDAFYDTASRPSIWAISPPGAAKGETSYDLWFRHVPGSGIDWAISEFADRWGMGHFSLTDAGYTPAYSGRNPPAHAAQGLGVFGANQRRRQASGKPSHPTRMSITRLGRAACRRDRRRDQGDQELGALHAARRTFDSAKDYFSGSCRLALESGVQKPGRGLVPEEFRDAADRRAADRRQDGGALQH